MDIGDTFRLTVSYSHQVADPDPDPELEAFLPSDLSLVFEILGEGVAFQDPTVPIPTIPGTPPTNPVDGTVTSISIPEPETMLLVAVAFVFATRR